MPLMMKKLDLSEVGSEKDETFVEITEGPEYARVIQETSAYSITPRTFVKRTLLDHVSFVDLYEHNNMQVCRFGFNPNAKEVFELAVSKNSSLKQEVVKSASSISDK